VVVKWDDTSDDRPGYLNSNASDVKYLIPNGIFPMSLAGFVSLVYMVDCRKAERAVGLCLAAPDR